MVLVRKDWFILVRKDWFIFVRIYDFMNIFVLSFCYIVMNIEFLNSFILMIFYVGFWVMWLDFYVCGYGNWDLMMFYYCEVYYEIIFVICGLYWVFDVFCVIV